MRSTVSNEMGKTPIYKYGNQKNNCSGAHTVQGVLDRWIERYGICCGGKRKTILLMNNIRILLSMRVPDWPLVKSIYIENFSSIHYIAIVR